MKSAMTKEIIDAAGRILLLSLFLLSPCAVAAPLGAGIQWKDPSSVQLEIDFPGNGYHASWDLFRCNCGDLLIKSELSVPGEVTHGDILLVASRAVLMSGYGPDEAEQISFDAPALMMQLTLQLLMRSEPAGPSAILEERLVDVEDPINHINLDTGELHFEWCNPECRVNKPLHHWT